MTKNPNNNIVIQWPHLIKTPLRPKNSVLIREVPFGEREYYIHSWYLLPRICVLSREMFSLESVLYERHYSTGMGPNNIIMLLGSIYGRVWSSASPQ